MKLSSVGQRAAFIEKQFGQIPKDLEKLELIYTRNIRAVYVKEYERVKSRIAGFYEQYAVKGKLTRGQAMAYNRLENMEQDIAEYIRDLRTQSRTITGNGIKDAVEDGYLRTRYAMETGLNVKTGLYGVNDRVVIANLANPFDRIGWDSRIKFNLERSFDRLQSAINEGIIQGYPYDKTAKLISDIGDKSFNDAVRIIRTEQHRAANVGFDEAYNEASNVAERYGIKTAKLWIAAEDDRTRDRHLILDGKTADDDGVFKVKGLTAEYPGGFGIAEMDINCRCTLGTKILDEGDGRLSETTEADNFNKWKLENKKQILQRKPN